MVQDTGVLITGTNGETIRATQSQPYWLAPVIYDLQVHIRARRLCAQITNGTHANRLGLKPQEALNQSAGFETFKPTFAWTRACNENKLWKANKFFTRVNQRQKGNLNAIKMKIGARMPFPVGQVFAACTRIGHALLIRPIPIGPVQIKSTIWLETLYSKPICNWSTRAEHSIPGPSQGCK